MTHAITIGSSREVANATMTARAESLVISAGAQCTSARSAAPVISAAAKLRKSIAPSAQGIPADRRAAVVAVLALHSVCGTL